MIVVLDANVILEDPLLNYRPQWEQLRDAVIEGFARVIIPEVALEEIAARRAEHLRTLSSQVNRVSKKVPKDARDKIDEGRALIEAAAVSYRTNLVKRVHELGFEIGDAPTRWTHQEVAMRATERVPPFSSNGGGYRDTLHWLTLLEIAEVQPREDATIVSNDGIFRSPNGARYELVDEFSNWSSGKLHVVPNIGALEIPGRYSGPWATADEDLHDSLLTLLNRDFDNESVFAGVPSRDLDLPSSDWFDVMPGTYINVRALAQRPVNQQDALDLRYRAVVDVQVRTTEVEGDSEEDLMLVSDLHRRTVLIGGNARTNTSRDEVDAIETLDVLRVQRGTDTVDDHDGWISESGLEALDGEE